MESQALPWRLEDIDLSAIEHAKVRDDEMLFYLLVTSSFVEIASDLYTRNLCTYYTATTNCWTGWVALGARGTAAWPRAARLCAGGVARVRLGRCQSRHFSRTTRLAVRLGDFEPTRGLELAARCMVETGTATFYRTIYAYTDEPVLKTIAGHIKSDEVRHYSHFWHFFNLYRGRGACEPLADSVCGAQARRRGT